MALCNRLRLFKRCCFPTFNFSTSDPWSNKWRIENGLEANPLTFGPLTDLPDYSFVDGRPVPLSGRKLRKKIHQKELCKKIVELSNEIDVGLENYYKRQEEEKQRKQQIIQDKLKPKGKALLKRKTSSVPKLET